MKSKTSFFCILRTCTQPSIHPSIRLYYFSMFAVCRLVSLSLSRATRRASYSLVESTAIVHRFLRSRHSPAIQRQSDRLQRHQKSAQLHEIVQFYRLVSSSNPYDFSAISFLFNKCICVLFCMIIALGSTPHQPTHTLCSGEGARILVFLLRISSTQYRYACTEHRIAAIAEHSMKHPINSSLDFSPRLRSTWPMRSPFLEC